MNDWASVREELARLSNFEFPRCIKHDSGKNSTYELICFCDASEKAYATVIYLRQVNSCGVQVDIVFAKSRLTPVKGMTIPRLELMAAVIGSRCIKFVSSQLMLTLERTILYSDSKCVLKWLYSDKDQPVFVKNRVSEIKNQRNVEFGYVKTSENPADVATRGCSPETLSESSLWWHGPEWLLAPVLVPDCEVAAHTCESNVCACIEVEKHEELACEIYSNKSPPFGIHYESYSSVTKLLRVTAYALRFVNNLKESMQNIQPLTSQEISVAETLWLRYIQNKHFKDVISAISNKKNNNLQRQLNLFIDKKGILRCRGRLQYAELTEGSRLPILLPKDDLFTRLIVRKHHVEILHCGVSQTLSHIRYKYWIPQGRSVVKSVIRQCNVCRRCEGGPYKLPAMPPIPKARVTSAPPFLHTGLDYLGPLYVKNESETRKVWVCLFTCLVTRAIHLELVQDMTSVEFLMAFHRFISTRGVPSDVTSDNALQFKQASAAIDLLWSKTVRSENVTKYVSEKGIKWNFIVERAPWFGGFYERLIGLVKRSLRKTLGRKLLKLVKIQTILKEVEAVVNGRPLVYVGDDVNSNITLTPNHFLTLNPNVGVPEMDNEKNDSEFIPCESSADKLLKLWQKGVSLLDKFWKIWRDDYLLSLRERTQSKLKMGRIQSSDQPSVGDIVLVKDDLPRSCWKLGRITRLEVSKDGQVRSAEVQQASGRSVRRSLSMLYPIETSNETPNEYNDTSFPSEPISTSPRPERKAKQVALQRLKSNSDKF